MKSIDLFLMPAAFLTMSAVITSASWYLSKKRHLSKSAEHLVMSLFVLVTFSVLFIPQSKIGGFFMIAQFVIAMLCYQHPVVGNQVPLAGLLENKKREP